MTCETANITIKKGKTFTRTLRWGVLPLIYKAITGISKAAPVVITAVGHSVVDGWPVAVVSAQGMREINADTPSKGAPPSSSQFKKSTLLTADTLSINEINSLEFTTYTSGGALVYYTPVNMSGYTARMQIRLSDTASGDPLETLTTENDGITIDNTAKTISILISATATAAYTFTQGVYELEMVSGTGVVTQILRGTVTVEGEVVR